MACGLTAQGSVGGCQNSKGGVKHSYACKLSDISSVTVTSGVISGFTMASTGLWKKLIPVKDNTAVYAQTSSRGGTNRAPVEQSAFLKFYGTAALDAAAANRVLECCDVVVIHVFNNGERYVQGIEEILSTGTPDGTNIQGTRIFPLITSGTTAEDARIEYTIQGQAYSFSSPTSLTDSAIEAL